VKKFIAKFPLLLINKRFFKITFLIFCFNIFLVWATKLLASFLSLHSSFESPAASKNLHVAYRINPSKL